jgi:hypothetical protein
MDACFIDSTVVSGGLAGNISVKHSAPDGRGTFVLRRVHVLTVLQ